MSQNVSHGAGARRVFYRRMVARSTDEPHRVATSLELFFDLCFVVAVALASSKLHHAIAEGDIGLGLLHYTMVFFAIWWAWMNFTWFASAFDTDDIPYRLLTMVQMGGVLVLAAGLPRAFDHEDFLIVVVGYIIMRLAMVLQWLRAGQANPESRAVALRYAAGIGACQVAWVALLLFEGDATLHRIGFFSLVIVEMLVPVFAERAGRTTWHPRHITERYGLFTLIVLGESILASSTAIQSGIDAGNNSFGFIGLAIIGLLLVFCMWWLYFDEPKSRLLGTTWGPFIWGYGHILIFGSAAALGAAIGAGIDFKTHEAPISDHTAVLAITLPVVIFLLSVWALQVLPRTRGLAVLPYPVAALVMLAIAASGLPGELIVVPPVLLVAVSIWTEAREEEAEEDAVLEGAVEAEVG